MRICVDVENCSLRFIGLTGAQGEALDENSRHSEIRFGFWIHMSSGITFCSLIRADNNVHTLIPCVPIFEMDKKTVRYLEL